MKYFLWIVLLPLLSFSVNDKDPSLSSFSQDALLKKGLPRPYVQLSKYSNQCKKKALEKMGWTFQDSQNQLFDSEVLFAKKDLQFRCNVAVKNKIELPNDKSADQNYHQDQQKWFDQILLSKQTQCLFQTAYNASFEKALKKIESNFFHFFYTLQSGEIVRLDYLSNEWKKLPCDSKMSCYQPQYGRLHQAMDVLSKTWIATDCAVGSQILQYMSIWELFGNKLAALEFSENQFLMGHWDDVNSSDSVLYGIKSDKVISKNGFNYLASGKETFIGSSGFIGAEKPELVDDKNNANENFVWVRTTQRALSDFQTQGGDVGYDSLLQNIWEKGRRLHRSELKGILSLIESNELHDVDELTLRAAILRKAREQSIMPSHEALKFVKEIQNPFLMETEVYVHPTGVRPILWHLIRLILFNPRTPYYWRFYDDGIHAEIFDRWVKWNLDQCETDVLLKYNVGAEQ